MTDVIFDAETYERSTTVRLELFRCTFKIHRSGGLDKIGRVRAFDAVELLHSKLSEHVNRPNKANSESIPPIRKFLLKGPTGLYLCRGTEIYINDIHVEHGSVRVNVIFWLATIASVYTGVAQYPEFREGFLQLKKDIESGMEYFQDSLATNHVQSEREKQPAPPEPSDTPDFQYFIRNDEDAETVLRTEIHNRLRK